MKSLYFSAAGLCLAALAAPCAALAQDDTTLVDRVVITAPAVTAPTTSIETPSSRPLEGPDVSQLLSRVPGGARLGNGALTGQVEYRGLFGPRLNLRIDGQNFASGGPNLMDPPLHYAPTALVEALEIDRGVSPVRAGPGLGGGLNAVFRKIDFTDSDAFRFGYNATVQGRTADESTSIGGIVGAANDHLRFNLMGAYDKGDDTRFPGGVIAGSSFERELYGVSTGARGDNQDVGFDFRRQHTGLSGTPALPMDIVFVNTDVGKLNYSGDFAGATFTAQIGYADVAHAMDNFDLRPGPAPAMQRRTDAAARTWSGVFGYARDWSGGTIRAGLDTEKVDRDVIITNPNNASFYVHNLPNIENRRTGGYVEWTGPLGPLNSELGLRTDHYSSSARLAATGPALPAMAANLAAAFNAADRTHKDDTVDVVARFWTDSHDGLSWRATLARKTRVPGYVERYSWLPTSASGGLADGNIYVGDLNLKPETAWIGEAGFDYRGERYYLRPTVYVRQVDNYVQGVPFDSTVGVIDTPQEMIASMNGDSTPLRFANVDARLYGFDVNGGAHLGGGWWVDATASYVRGERRDINDNLYRISPPSLTVGLTYDASRWSVTGETRMVADQTKVSATNSEAPTAGFAIVNLYGEWTVRDGVRVMAGVENLLDKRYEDHLAGYNQISGSDVPVGARLPGAGRGAFVRLSVAR